MRSGIGTAGDLYETLPVLRALPTVRNLRTRMVRTLFVHTFKTVCRFLSVPN